MGNDFHAEYAKRIYAIRDRLQISLSEVDEKFM